MTIGTEPRAAQQVALAGEVAGKAFGGLSLALVVARLALGVRQAEMRECQRGSRSNPNGHPTRHAADWLRLAALGLPAADANVRQPKKIHSLEKAKG